MYSSNFPNIGETLNSEVNPAYSHLDSEVIYSFNEDTIPIVNPGHLFNVSTFQQLFLIGKILGESLPTKLIASKCSAEWKPSGEFSTVDMGNGFSLVKCANPITVIEFSWVNLGS